MTPFTIWHLVAAFAVGAAVAVWYKWTTEVDKDRGEIEKAFGHTGAAIQDMNRRLTKLEAQMRYQGSDAFDDGQSCQGCQYCDGGR